MNDAKDQLKKVVSSKQKVVKRMINVIGQDKTKEMKKHLEEKCKKLKSEVSKKNEKKINHLAEKYLSQTVSTSRNILSRYANAKVFRDGVEHNKNSSNNFDNDPLIYGDIQFDNDELQALKLLDRIFWLRHSQ